MYYVYNQAGKDLGPFTSEQLLAKLDSGEFPPNKLVRTETSKDDWMVLSIALGITPAESHNGDNMPASAATPANLNAALIKRYNDAYSGAHAVVTVGKAIKGVSVILGICMILLSLLIGVNIDGGIVAVVGGLIIGCIVGIPTYILGILVAAEGQIQLATLDSAVNGSRHLTDDEVARLLTKKWSL